MVWYGVVWYGMGFFFNYLIYFTLSKMFFISLKINFCAVCACWDWFMFLVLVFWYWYFIVLTTTWWFTVSKELFVIFLSFLLSQEFQGCTLCSTCGYVDVLKCNCSDLATFRMCCCCSPEHVFLCFLQNFNHNGTCCICGAWQFLLWDCTLPGWYWSLRCFGLSVEEVCWWQISCHHQWFTDKSLRRN